MNPTELYTPPKRSEGPIAQMFSLRGRIGRKTFIAQSLLSIVALIGASLVIVILLTAANPQKNVSVAACMILFIFFMFILNQVSANGRRLHDMGLSAWTMLLSFLPGLNLVFFFFLAAYPSVPGPNRYGQNPHDSAMDILRHGKRFEAKEKWKRAFSCYASIVEDDRFSEHAKDLAIEHIELLQSELAARGIVRF